MINQIKNSKWYWYIPLLSMFFLHEISVWVLEAKGFDVRYERNNVVLMVIIPIHLLAIIGIIFKIGSQGFLNF